MPIHFHDLNVLPEVERARSVLIVPCNMCPAVTVAAREGRPFIEVRAIRDQVYGLALRMLAEPADAEDATQEILIKVITRLDSFRGESRFTTWVYAVAINHLRTLYGRRQRRWRWFERVEDLQGSRLPAVAPVAERAVLVGSFDCSACAGC